MTFSNRMVPCFVAIVSFGLGSLAMGTTARAQDSGIELHAHGKISAADIGLPAYPGAKLFKDAHESDPTADLGFSFGDVHFRLLVAKYATGDAGNKVLDFYRKPLSRYGEVLECDHGKPVGRLQRTTSGLTCDSGQGEQGHLNVNGNSSDDVELRAGTPHKFRIVGIDSHTGGQTQFGLVYVELPRDTSSNHPD
ncbi:MAG: hypothetical protein ACLGSD_06705 [Acidobacteriota bacterium]